MYIRIIPKIDIANAPTCLACPLTECVFMLPESAKIRQQCPVWRAERGRYREAMQRHREKKRAARVSLNRRKEI